ncbi:MAG: PilZ domain-containing protein [Proteobacteria bacterium]|nr:PilZ domain-containing protein [Pseudomonadota bacterium]
MKKRVLRNRRVPFRFIIMYGIKRPLEYRSFTADISDTGLFVKTNRVFTPGTRIYMTIKVHNNNFDCEGMVRWAKRVPPGLERVARCGMGIKFSTVPQGLLNIYKEKIL